jgi:hypothetical protein
LLGKTIEIDTILPLVESLEDRENRMVVVEGNNAVVE